MTDEFLPEYRAVPTASGWRPSFRRFVGEREKLVPYPGGPRYFPSAEQAKAAAMEYLKVQFNTPVAGCVIEPKQELDEYTRWRRQKDEQERAERARVFGAKPAAPRNVSGSSVVVEYRRKVRA